MAARDTISIIMENLSSLRVFGNKTTTIVENIKCHLLSIKEVAEDKDAMTTPDWLIGVTDVITDLQDMLEDQNLPLDSDSLPKQRNITSYFSQLNLSVKRRSLLLQLKQIEKQLQHIVVNSSNTNLSQKNYARLTSSSLLKDEAVAFVGRFDEIERIGKRIFELGIKVQGDVPAVAISGIRGLGKTKFAKYFINQDWMSNYCDLIIWIDNVHDEFYAESVVEQMIHEAINKKKLEHKVENLNLGEALDGRSFFLVLDDLQSQNHEEWVKLHQMLKEAAKSSFGAVLVTTQHYVVANAIEPDHMRLSAFNERDSWTLFENVAGGDPSDLKIRDMRRKMVNKCEGIPLVIVTLARIFRSCEAIDESHLEQEFMQEMQSIYYNNLPSWHLKQCFAYLSLIFSMNTHILPETFIRIWMAEGILGPVNSYSSLQQSQPEDLGFDYLRELCLSSILVANGPTYTMGSKLMLELSAFVAGKDRFTLWMDGYGENVKESVKRVSITSSFDVSNGIAKYLTKNNKSLRSILFPLYYVFWSHIPHEKKLSHSACDAILCGFKSLRVLNLSMLGIRELPISIGELKSLRYLDLSFNNMKKLPNTIGKLKRLQTLILSHCKELSWLPDELNHLVSLRYLEMKNCLHLNRMPSTLKKLTKLQALPYFVVNTSYNHKYIEDLGGLMNLDNLKGDLEISHLERLKFEGSKKDGHGYLKEKQHIKNLTLRWSHDDEDNDNDNDNHHHDQISLGHLEPHPNLQQLTIEGYRGTKFSYWYSSLGNLVTFTLYNCSMCKSLPSLDQFPKLETLKLWRLDSLEHIIDEDNGCNELGLGLLTNLSILDCPNLISWWKGKTHSYSTFDSIRVLEVQYCPKFICMPLYPSLDDKLKLVGSSMKPLLETISYKCPSNLNSSQPLSKLRQLILQNIVDEQSPLQEDFLKNFVSLTQLRISGTSYMKGIKHLSALSMLTISNCTGVDLSDVDWAGLQIFDLELAELTKLQSIPKGIKHLSSLYTLTITNCPELITLTEDFGDLETLQYLDIRHCHKLGSLPQGMVNLLCLIEMIIEDCPLLLPRCQKETGDDWPQIKHITSIKLIGPSQVYD